MDVGTLFSETHTRCDTQNQGYQFDNQSSGTKETVQNKTAQDDTNLSNSAASR